MKSQSFHGKIYFKLNKYYSLSQLQFVYNNKKYDKVSPYYPQYQILRTISERFQTLFQQFDQNVKRQLLKYDSQKSDHGKFLQLGFYFENFLDQFDQQYKAKLDQYKKVKIVFNSDIAYVIFPTDAVQQNTCEAEEIFKALNEYCQQQLKIQLKSEIHVPKLQFYLDYDNRGQIQSEDIDDFITFIWCNPQEKFEFLSDQPFFTTQSNPNKLKLILRLVRSTQENDQCPKQIEIDELGYCQQNREKIRKPVRFGRKALNNYIPCDVFFGQKEMTISKRQFVIKPNLNDYYAYCISTTNPTEFLVQTEGVYVTQESVITLSDKLCIAITQCVVLGVEEDKSRAMSIENEDPLADGPTVRRGNKNNPALKKIQEDQKLMESINNQNEYNKKKPVVDDEDEITCKEEHKTYEKKKGGMNEIKKYFQQKINNQDPVDQESGEKEYSTQQFKKDKTTGTGKTQPQNQPNKLIPNIDLKPKDQKNKNKCFIKFVLEWCDLDNEDIITNAIEKFNNIDMNKKEFKIGSSKNSDICIEDPSIKDTHVIFRYNMTENRWMMYDPDTIQNYQNVQQYTTIAFKGNLEKNHSELFRLQKGAIIVVSGNFLEVDLQENVQKH